MPDKPATRDFHPARVERLATAPRRPRKPSTKRFVLPKREKNVEVELEGKVVKLTNLDKPFWPERGITKRDLIQYYADVSPVLLPHLCDRAMVMKRYPHGAHGEFFFMKRVPVPHPPWIQTCSIEHESQNVIDFPVIQDLPSLLWCINLGCIDLNPWYGRCDDVDRRCDDVDRRCDDVRGGQTIVSARGQTGLPVLHAPVIERAGRTSPAPPPTRSPRNTSRGARRRQRAAAATRSPGGGWRGRRG